ncbi:MAG: sodium:proton antiporter [Nitrospiraceae bacterium]|jgi:cell volume regulation protein A|nr:sodium:proton antiporter [Nitrospiraceae bacterium]
MLSTHVLFFAATIFLIVSLVLSRLAEEFKLPDILFFLGLGVALGPSGFGFLSSDGGEWAPIMLSIGASFILFDAGLDTSFERLRKHRRTIGILTTAGIVLSAFLTMLLARYILNLSWAEGALLGAILASTDPTAIVPILRSLPIPKAVRDILMTEAALGDVTGALLTFSVAEFALSHESTQTWISDGLVSLGLIVPGILAGVLLGALSVVLIAHTRYDYLSKNAQIVGIAAVGGSYLLSEKFHASGFLAVYVLGVVLGNPRTFDLGIRPGPLPGILRIREGAGATAFLARVAIFTVLGAHMKFQAFGISPWLLVLFIAGFIFLVRPATIFLLLPSDHLSGVSRQERIFMAATRETGIMSATLASLFESRLPGSVHGTVFWTIVGTIVVGGGIKPFLVKKLKFSSRRGERSELMERNKI